MFHLERFHDVEATYLIVEAHEFRRATRGVSSPVERVGPFEARRVLERVMRREPLLFARLHEALTGMRPPAGTFRMQGIAHVEALEAKVLDAFGGANSAPNPAGVDFARFYLLRDQRRHRPTGTQRLSPESQRIDKALSVFGRDPFTHRGETYHMQRVGAVDSPVRIRDLYETLSEAQLLSVLRALAEDTALDATRKGAAGELLAAAETQRKQRGHTELVLRRRQRAHGRLQEDSAPAITPSQMRKASVRHWVEVHAVDPDGKPVSDVALELELADGSLRHSATNAEGFARLEPVPAGSVMIRLSRIDGSMWRALAGPPSRLARQAPGTRWHRVAQGECSSKIAHRHGVQSWRDVWEHAENGPLRERRKSPHVLLPGDRVAIPGVNVHEIVRSTDATHVIELRSAQDMELQLRLHDGRRRGIDGLSYRIAFTHQGREVVRPGVAPSARDGLISERVPVGVERVVIAVDRPKLTFSFLIGHLDPIQDEQTKRQVVSGVEARLSALAYRSGSHALGLREALAAFQREQLGREQAEGDLDDPTAQKLLEMYGA